MINASILAAFALQWIVIAFMAVLIVGLFRQVGLLHERLGPVGALTLPGGPAVGAPAPVFELESLNGGIVKIGGNDPAGRSTLVFFLSPTCPVCKSLLPVLLSMAREAAPTRLVLASDGDEASQRRMIERERLGAYPFVLSGDLGRAHGVGKLPYAVLLDPKGAIAAKGLVNNREHIESLFEAQRLGRGSLQEHLRLAREASSEQVGETA